MERIKAVIRKIRFYNEENGYIILQASSDEHKSFSITGNSYNIEEKEVIECEGEWVIDKKFGQQFVASKIEISKPDTLEGIRLYLSSGILPGIGPTSAAKIVSHFKDKVFDILDKNPARLLDVQGIGRKTLNKIIESWNEKRISPNIINELHTYGLDFNSSLKLYKAFGEDSIKFLKSKPYELISIITTLSFEDIDKIALKNGHTKEDSARILQGILYAFKIEEDSFGNCAVEYDVIVEKAYKILKIHKEYIEKVLELGYSAKYFDKYLINDKEYWQSFKISKLEEDIAFFLKKISTTKPYGVSNLEDKIKREEAKSFPLSEEQRDAIHKSINNKINIINGGPGVGKTTVLKQLISIVKREGYSVLLCAPTGRAAQRMAESTGVPAFTIHRALEYNPMEQGFSKNMSNPLEYDFIVIDEFSMVDIYMMHSLLAAVNKNSHLIIIGDTNQLPSIGPGSVLKDLIDSNCIAVSRIVQIRRQAAKSKIIVNAHRINEGLMVENSTDADSDFYFISTKSDASTLEKIKELVENRIEKAFNIDPKTGIQLLTPVHAEALGTKNLNNTMQKILNFTDEEGLKKGNYTYQKNDNIMQVKNNYDKMVFNGDVGIIDRIAQDGVLATFAEQEVFYSKKEMEEIMLSYAITIHKSQGSEYPAVIIPISHKFSSMLDRSLLYTAVTRGKNLVIIVGSKTLFEKALQNEISRRRNTCLKEKIMKCFTEN